MRKKDLVREDAVKVRQDSEGHIFKSQNVYHTPLKFQLYIIFMWISYFMEQQLLLQMLRGFI